MVSDGIGNGGGGGTKGGITGTATGYGNFKLKMERELELKSLWSQQIPFLINTSTLVLENIYQTLLTSRSTDPPLPSPASTPSFSTPTHSFSQPYPSPLPTPSPQSHSKSLDSHFLHSSNLSTSLKSQALNSLYILEKLFSWIPLESYLSMSLLNLILKFSQFGFTGSMGNFGGIGVGGEESGKEIGVVGLNCLSEILERNYVPKDVEPFLGISLNHFIEVLQYLTHSSSSLSSPVSGHVNGSEGEKEKENRVESLDEVYRDKLIDALYLLVTNHIQRVEVVLKSGVVGLFELIKDFMLLMPTPTSYLSTIRIFHSLLDYLQHKNESSVPIPTSVSSLSSISSISMESSGVDIYKNGLLNLADVVLGVIKSVNEGKWEGEGLDEMKGDNESQSEYDQFLTPLVELIAKISDLFPNDVFGLTFPLLSSQVETYNQLGQVIQVLESQPNESLKTQVAVFRKNINTLLRLYGRFSHHFIYDFEKMFEFGYTIFTKFLELSCDAMANKWWRNDEVAIILQNLLAAMKSYVSWLCNFRASIKTDASRQEVFDKVYSCVVEICVALILETNPQPQPHLLTTSSLLLHSITTTVRPESLFSIPSFQRLMSELHVHSDRLPTQVKQKCYETVTNAILLPYYNRRTEEQKFDARMDMFKNWMSGVVNEFVNVGVRCAGVDSSKGEGYSSNYVRGTIQKTLSIFSVLARSLSSECNQSKAAFFEGIKPVLPITHTYLEIYMNDNETLSIILEFYLTLFDSLRSKVPIEYTKNTLTLFLQLLNGNAIDKILMVGSSNAGDVVERFLQILKFIVDDATKSFEVFLPNIISYILNDLYPRLNLQRNETTAMSIIFPTYYTLIQKLLTNHWRFFFPTTSVQIMVSNGSIMQNKPLSKNEPEFIALCKCLVSAFQRSNIESFRLNLSILNGLNEGGGKLYYKDIFKSHIQLDLLHVLFTALLSKTHDLLREEIIHTVVNIVRADIVGFHQKFLQLFIPTLKVHHQHVLTLSNYLTCINESNTEHQLNLFFNDYQYYKRIQG
ncbi:hypothetical protein BKA69DRAFT_1071285 [Paraphysoderma sedebokerense]|nr:hypothetical protein BKA69DRAFT_1071285 [Paraphysoderma sedebokerense]